MQILVPAELLRNGLQRESKLLMSAVQMAIKAARNLACPNLRWRQLVKENNDVQTKLANGLTTQCEQIANPEQMTNRVINTNNPARQSPATKRRYGGNGWIFRSNSENESRAVGQQRNGMTVQCA